MSEQTPQENAAGYDPARDQDADPESLEPRQGSQASGAESTTQGDPDADPDMLNPREVESGDEL
ncbi:MULTISPECIES: hypothetical protein [unclassified Actinotalea]|uniref:hypothetical protein n=1 Tax=unclassified Actinotalea TaxID=2638618 RepID=UPI0015F43058|nr:MULTISPECIES: hypothetical protein [unclassified Actinotalea]